MTDELTIAALDMLERRILITGKFSQDEVEGLMRAARRGMEGRWIPASEGPLPTGQNIDTFILRHAVCLSAYIHEEEPDILLDQCYNDTGYKVADTSHWRLSTPPQTA